MNCISACRRFFDRPGFGQAAGLLQCLAQQEFDLAIRAAKLIVGPFLEGVEEFRVDA